MSASVRLGPRPESIAAARRFVTEQLPHLSGDIREVARLCVSELATNCVVHAKTPFTVHISSTERFVRVEVTDASPEPPQPRQPRVTEAHGRGLQIVRRLAHEWGTQAASTPPGKTVWFVLATRAA